MQHHPYGLLYLQYRYVKKPKINYCNVKCYLLVIMLSCCMCKSFAQHQQLRKQQKFDIAKWEADIDYLHQFLVAGHKNVYHSVSKKVVEEKFLSLKHSLPFLKRHEIIMRMASIVAMLNDGHSRLQLFRPQVNFTKFPISLYRFSDGYFIQSIDSSFQWAVGTELIAINNHAVGDVYDSVSNLVSRDNMYGLWEFVPKYMMISEVLSYYKIISDSSRVILTVKTSDGSLHKLALKADAMPSAQDFLRFETGQTSMRYMRDTAITKSPLYLQNMNRLLHCEIIKGSHDLYVQINEVRSDPRYGSFASFCERLFFLCDSANVDKIIIDVRFNRGGDASLIKPLLHGIIRRPHVNKKGKLFLITGRRTFSAAGQLVTEMTEATNVTLVGEPTATGPNRYGETGETILPNSKIQVTVSTQWIQRGDPDDVRKYFGPEVAAELNSELYKKNIDPCLYAIDRYNDTLSIYQKLLLAYLADTSSSKTINESITRLMKDPEKKFYHFEVDVIRVSIAAYRNRQVKAAINILESILPTYGYSPHVNEMLGDFSTEILLNKEAKKYYEKALLSAENGYQKFSIQRKIDSLINSSL